MRVPQSPALTIEELIMLETTKQCSRCKKIKNLSEFYKRKASADGLTPICKDCVKLKCKNEYALKSEKIKIKVRQYTENNREKINASRANFRENNRDRLRATGRERKDKDADVVAKYRKTNAYRMSCANSRHKVRAQKKATADKSVPIKMYYPLSLDLQNLLDGQKNKCNQCGCELVEKELDHYIPLSKGGFHRLSNLQWLCKNCNQRKSAMTPSSSLVFHLR